MKKILIIGGGAGGLELATQLGRKYGKKRLAEVTLVDKNRTHIWKPLLHEVATGSLDTSTDGVVYHAHAAKHHYRFQLGEFCHLNAESKTVTLAPSFDSEGEPVLPERQLNYDILVLAVGSVSNDFGTPGVADHCYFLDSHQQAERFHHGLLNNFIRINQQERAEELHIAIVGGGATGVELSAELYHVADLLKSYGMPGMSARQLKISLIEAGPRILPALPGRISLSARKELVRLGVEVRESVRVASACKDGFVTADDELIKADMMIWAAGVKAPDFIARLDVFETNRNNQILVEPTLQAKGYSDIWVIGDCCACEQPDGSWVPPRAQSAHQMAEKVRLNLTKVFKGEIPEAYLYKDHGSLVNLSRYSTVGSLMGNLTSNSMFIEGRIARAVYISLYRMHQIAIHGWPKAVLIILAEKLGKVVRPKMKLH
ncbi:NAD(P)/FAD-dependent oxidoreductase [Oceanospirillum sediminis]|uniref:NAD(P)/FAD-dependent oxidoreductase n=1 Tax=Oceanospirillum sediminis TaxID=2760088 RepID=A0A839IKG6_9GAMM|nr:NAD(P)/FAD-dependent oxidoreductase [Oceanospirillum sediminis]MBB1485843.1 NAD(P)/FAD-dependent oxidoreductase [Oceanospirillum sediminis]